MWYQQPYINRRDWLLTNLNAFNLTSVQICILLLIDLANSVQMTITNDYFIQQLNEDESKINEALADLMAKKYLKIKVSGSKVIYDISALFKQEQPAMHVDGSVMDLISLFTSEFGRDLSASEVNLLTQLKHTVDENMIKDALKQAIIYDKKNMNYVSSIAMKWKENPDEYSK